jgi:hypothetical protein
MARATDIPAIGKIAGLARKEPIYDTEGWAAAAVLPAQIITFANFTTFATAGLSLVKAFGRDTNLTGGQGGLPQAHRFFWFKWRAKLRALGANLNTPANRVAFEQIIRARQLSNATFQLAQTRYITVQMDELIGFTDSMYVAGSAATTLDQIYPVMNVGDRQGRDVTAGKEPKILEPLENFQSITQTPTIAAPLTPTVDIYVTHHLDGILVRGVVG